MPQAGSTAPSRFRTPDEPTAAHATDTGATDAWADYAPVITYFVAVGVGLAWCFLYSRFTSVFPDGKFGGSAYRYRDDALITLSHARGWSDVGTISVGTSGARVEAFSSPLQFALASIFFRLGGRDPRTFIDWQIPCATFVLGVSVFSVCRLAAPHRSRIDA